MENEESQIWSSEHHSLCGLEHDLASISLVASRGWIRIPESWTLNVESTLSNYLVPAHTQSLDPSTASCATIVQTLLAYLQWWEAHFFQWYPVCSQHRHPLDVPPEIGFPVASLSRS